MADKSLRDIDYKDQPSTSGGSDFSAPVPQKVVYKFETDWVISSVAWSNRSGQAFRLALASYLEVHKNYVQIVYLEKDSCDKNLESQAVFEHPYPATKLMWAPDKLDLGNQDLIATTADYLRIWRVSQSGETKLESLLNSDRRESRALSPLTSFDWNDVDPSLIVTSGVNSLCTVWDVEAQKAVTQYTAATVSTVRTQIRVHHKEVCDVSFSRLGSGRDAFLSCGSDGFVIMSDLRRPSYQNLLYKHPRSKAMVRVYCCKRNPNLAAAFALDSNRIALIDIRKPLRPIESLEYGHQDSVKALSWAPHSEELLCSVGRDGQTLIWDLSSLSDDDRIVPSLRYRAKNKINAASWSSKNPAWIAIGYEKSLELLRV